MKNFQKTITLNFFTLVLFLTTGLSKAQTFELRINAGGTANTEVGIFYETDEFFTGGRGFTNTSAAVPELYRTERSSTSRFFSYDIPLPNGEYTIVLHFAEIYWGSQGGGSAGIGRRIFDVRIENNVVLDNYDISADVGADTPVTKTFELVITDGELNIDFSALSNVGGVDQPKVSAIEVIGSEVQNPEVIHPGDQTNTEGDIISLPIVATNGNGLSYTASGLPPGLNINSSTGVISGTISSGTEGNGGLEEQNGLVVAEIESGIIVSNWSATTLGGSSGIIGGNDHFNNQNGGTIPYEIMINTPGVYRFNWRSLFNGSNFRDQNDSWVRFPNTNGVWFFGFRGNPGSEAAIINNLEGPQNDVVFPGGSPRQSASTIPEGASSNGYLKIYRSGGRSGVYDWQALTNDNVGHNVYVRFENAGTYTMEVSERSAGHTIDKFALYKVDGPDYTDSQLTAFEETRASRNTPGAAVGSPYSVDVNVMGSGSSSIQFNWIVGAIDPIASAIIWQEDFEGLPNGTTVDTGNTAWTSERNGGTFEVENGSFITTENSDGPGEWVSELIEINGSASVSIAVSAPDQNKENTTFSNSEVVDFIEVFYRVDGGPRIPIDQRIYGNLTEVTFSEDDIIGNGIQLIVVADVSFRNEAYLIDNVTVRGSVPTIIAVSGVTIDQEDFELFVNDTAALSAEVAPLNASNTAVSWTSADTSIATVDAAGSVTAVGVGTTTIIVETLDGGFTDEVVIQVMPLNSSGLATRSGEFQRFHKLTFTWDGPDLPENEQTFENYRLNITFLSPSGLSYTVPGYFAADGNAGETSATSGNKWRCHFTALETGEWTYTASFRTGINIAISLEETNGSPLMPIHGDTGTFSIGETTKVGKDFRSKGKLEYVGEHFMQWTTGEYFMKIGSDSPENFLEFEDFDNTNSNRTYPTHINDWNTGDPLWQNDKGRGILGAVNYLSDKGVNSQYFVIQRGGEVATPWTSPPNTYATYDVSKMDQWQIVFDHMMTKGLMAHFVLSESTNQSFFEEITPGGDVDFSDTRKLYFREMIARFGYLNAITWNLGEENGWDRGNGIRDAITTQQRLDFAAYIDALAYYKDHITVHNGPAGDDSIYGFLIGDNSFTGTAMQGRFNNTNRSRESVKRFREQSTNANKKWVVYYDEAWISSATNIPTFRKNVLWATLTSGGAGIEHYASNGLDVSLQDLRFFDDYWTQMNFAHNFYTTNDIPFHEMYSQDELVTNGWCHGKDFDTYVIYVEAGNAGTTSINVLGEYSVKWFDPRNGGALQNGSVQNIVGGTNVDLGNPPSNTTEDWVILLQNTLTEPVAVTGVTVNPSSVSIGTGFTRVLNAEVIPANATETAVLWSSDNPAIATVDSNGNIMGVALGTTVIRVTTVDGNFAGQVTIDVIDSTNFCSATGTIRMERYDDINGVQLTNLFNAPNYPNNPSATQEIDRFEIETNTRDNYGVRISGYLCAPETGVYTFWIAGDDYVRLNLSTNEQISNIRTVAFHNSFTASREWNKFSTQRSSEIVLNQGQTYYIEAFMKEGGGGDNLAVGWRKPSDGSGTSPAEVIPGTVLSPDLQINARINATLFQEEQLSLSSEGAILLFPNPVVSEVQLKMEATDDVIMREIKVYDITGRLLQEYEASRMKIGEGTYQLNVSNMDNGLYFIHLTSEKNNDYQVKMIINR